MKIIFKKCGMSDLELRTFFVITAGNGPKPDIKRLEFKARCACGEWFYVPPVVENRS